MRRNRTADLPVLFWGARSLAPMLHHAGAQSPEGRKPNILVIMGDDIGIMNLSTDHQGVMGYRTPNIDRLADEGRKFMTCYGQQSSTIDKALEQFQTATPGSK